MTKKGGAGLGGIASLPQASQQRSTLSEVLLADMATVSWRTKPRKKWDTEKEITLHANPVSLGLTALGGAATFWLLGLKLKTKYNYYTVQQKFVVELPLGYGSWRSYLPQDYAFSADEWNDMVMDKVDEKVADKWVSTIGGPGFDFVYGVAKWLAELLAKTTNEVQEEFDGDQFHRIMERYETVYHPAEGYYTTEGGYWTYPIHHAPVWVPEHQVWHETKAAWNEEVLAGYRLYAQGFQIKRKGDFMIEQRKGFLEEGIGL